MCGRFALWTPPSTITRYFRVNVKLESAPRYNVAPGQQIIVIRQSESDNRKAVFLKWGLIPGWAKEEKIGYKLINARAESIHEKTSFKAAFKSRRCLIPASGFYEWEKDKSGKYPYLIRFTTTELFAMAGIWESWQNRETLETTESCAIITTSANTLVSVFHDRMPVIIHPDDFNKWLDSKMGDAGHLKRMMKPYPVKDMECCPVSNAVNNPRYDDPSIVDPINLSVSRE